MNGLFITIEGIDGSGKTSILEKFENEISNDNELNNRFVFTREPGGRGVYRSEFIKNELLFNNNVTNTPILELLMFTLSRRIHLEDLIWPSLCQNKIVVSDRYIDSTYVYQGQRLDKSIIDKSLEILNPELNKIMPDFTIYFKVSLENAQLRRSVRTSNNKLDNNSDEFYQIATNNYDELASKNSNRFIVIDANQPFDKVYEDFKNIIHKMVNNY